MEMIAKYQTIQEILEKSNYSITDFSNKKRAVRSINSVLKNSNIKLEFCEIGKVWGSKTGGKANFIISLDGVAKKAWYIQDLKNHINMPYTILKLIGKFLLLDEVRNKITADVEIPCKCAKCEGAGVIPQFYYYADGICFDCLGLGIVGKLSVTNVNKPMNAGKYVNQFYISKNFIESFPSGVNKIKPVNFIGHETAETFLGEKDDNYYVYQPVCMANHWYCIPKEIFDQFKTEFKKVTKIDL